jgi:dienelactone hydrolase
MGLNSSLAGLRRARGTRLAQAAALALALLLAVCGCGSESSATPFDYDATAPLRFVDYGQVNDNNTISVRDVSFGIPDGRQVEGFLVIPSGVGPFPGAVFLHGSGGDRNELLLAAIALAGRGAESLLITSPTTTYSSKDPPEKQLAAQRAASVASVIATRRAADVLSSRPEVDDSKIGLLGWSAGARTGAIVAGLDRRFSAFDLLSGGGTPVADYAAAAPEELRDLIERELGDVDPLRWIPHALSGSVLLQNGRSDEVVPRAALDAMVAAAGKAAEVRWYDQKHEPSPLAFREGLAWLATKLGIAEPAM